MPKAISADLTGFTKALESGKNIACNRKGQWVAESGLMRIIRKLFGGESSRLIAVASAFNKVLDQLEKVPVKFNADSSVIDAQKKNLDLHLKAAESVKKHLEKSKSHAAKKKVQELSLRVVSLLYRHEEVNGGLDKALNVDQSLYLELEKLVKDWKNRYPLYQDKSLSLGEKEKIAEACRYPSFAQLLKCDKGLRVFFFKWALRDNCEVGAFVQFPAISTRLKNAFLAGRIGRFSNQFSLMKLHSGLPKKDTPYEKDYTLPIEVQEGNKLKVEQVSVLDDQKVVNTACNYKRTIKQVIASFANRNSEPGNFEMLGPGQTENGENLPARIANHNCLELGPYNPQTKDFIRPVLDEGRKEWWKQIPPFDTMSLEEVQEMYGVSEVKDGKWVVAVRSSREDVGLDVDKSHGFLDVLIPDGTGNYQLYPFGKYAANWPSNLIEKAFFITNTVKSKIACPDENHFMGQRQQAVAPWVISEKDGLELMENIRKDLIKAQKGNIVFQFPWENCAWWSQKLLEKLLGPKKLGGPVPNFFRGPLLQAQPKVQPLPQIFRFCRKLTGKVQEIVVKIIELILFSWRGTTIIENGKKVFKSVPLSHHMKKLEIYHPSMLHQRIISKEVKGRITMGMMFLNQTH